MFKGLGKGHITDTGRYQHLEMGVNRRNEYVKSKKLLSEKYNPEEILAMSTFKQRCAVSAEQFMHGLYPFQDIHYNKEVRH